MTLEALVRTVEAIDRTECIDARASLCIAKSPPLFSIVSVSGQSLSRYACLLFLMQNLQTRYVITQTTKTPLMTPPAIGPAAVPPEPDDAPDVG
jgi:hypothetical protein